MLKIENIAQRLAIEGISGRTQLFGKPADWFYRYPWLKHLPALHNRVPLPAKLNSRLLSISSTTKLPEIVTSTNPFSDTDPEAVKAEVLLLIDTFTQHFQPNNADAALTVLKAAGYKVFVAQAEHHQQALCCGRTHLAHGLVDEAKANAIRILNVLLPHETAGRSIIGLEPACLLALRDDYKYLGLGDMAEQVAAKAILFEEFLTKEVSAKRFRILLPAPNPQWLRARARAPGRVVARGDGLNTRPNHERPGYA